MTFEEMTVIKEELAALGFKETQVNFTLHGTGATCVIPFEFIYAPQYRPEHLMMYLQQQAFAPYYPKPTKLLFYKVRDALYDAIIKRCYPVLNAQQLPPSV